MLTSVFDLMKVALATIRMGCNNIKNFLKGFWDSAMAREDMLEGIREENGPVVGTEAIVSVAEAEENVLVGACCASSTEKVGEKGSVLAFGKMGNGLMVALDDAASKNEENKGLASAADALLKECTLTPPPTQPMKEVMDREIAMVVQQKKEKEYCGGFYNRFMDFGHTLARIFVIGSDDLLVLREVQVCNHMVRPM
uniref:AlNc14C46G3739 protein n=1 Tax=Albugo laibachii Nc14 TaxID=890382 RepID=F0WAL5_9STRA|nr:AlNc14C46G3739 [Albugo laibachii Nc14]|eukprot:CCA18186.1 AlNc14C46G3739 [Albugo laibachii Nc14]